MEIIVVAILALSMKLAPLMVVLMQKEKKGKTMKINKTIIRLIN